jgi:excinuclease ABC subunit C
VASAKSAGLKIPLIALAKKNEEIFIQGESRSIILEKSNPALKLLMEIRDEVHRFAISYHRKLRSKKLGG